MSGISVVSPNTLANTETQNRSQGMRKSFLGEHQSQLQRRRSQSDHELDVIWAQLGHGRLDLVSNDGSFVGPLPLHLWSEEKRLTPLLVALESLEHFAARTSLRRP